MKRPKTEAASAAPSFRAPAALIFTAAFAVRLLHVWQMRDTLFFSVLMGDSRGYDAKTDQWVDMFKAGILDPAKVTRSALQNAASIAAIVLTAESAVVEKPEEDEPEAAGHGHMH